MTPSPWIAIAAIFALLIAWVLFVALRRSRRIEADTSEHPDDCKCAECFERGNISRWQ